MIRITDQYFWNFVFSLFFLALVAFAAIVLDGEAYKGFEELTLIDLLLITLATWRLIRLFVYDAITKFVREQFLDVKETRGKMLLVKPEKGPRRTISDLLSCPWCFGVWACAAVTFFYLLTPLAFYFVLFLALSAVATFLQILTNMIGWRAEGLKSEVEKK